jgi:hypothetical protein
MWPRPWRAMRAATLMSWLRMVAPRAFAWQRPASVPAARVRLRQIAAQGSHAAFAGKCPDQMSQRPVAAVREDLPDDGVVAVLGLGLDHLEWRVSEHGMAAPAGEQLVLAFGGPGVEVFDPADDQPGGDRLAFP